MQDIEDEKFDFDFSIVFVTEEEASKILDIIKNVSEIKDAVLTEIKEPLKTEDDNAPAEASKEEHKNEAPAQDSAEKKPAPSAAKKPAQAASAKPGVKPVGRSVRVDIEKLDVLMNLVSELIIAKNGLVARRRRQCG